MPPAEHASFTADDGQIWSFDVAFMTSRYTCTFGRGCGTDGVGECCVHGATLWFDPDNAEECAADEARVRARAKELTAEEWQLKRDKPFKKADGVPMTKTVRGGCVFSNRGGFAAGEGCALHLAALAHGESPLDYKPRVCWAVPIMRQELDDGSYLVRAVQNRDWSPDNSEEPLDWWCIDDPANYIGEQPVFRALAEELTRMCGEEVYAQLATHLERRRRRTTGPLLPMA